MSRAMLFRLVAIGAVVLVVGVALCAFDDDASGDDLCMISLASVAAGPMASSVAVFGDPAPWVPDIYRLLLADLPPPPPKA